MRYLYLVLTALLLFSCVSTQTARKVESEIRDDLAKVSFVNLSSEDVYLRLRRGNTEQNIGILNLDENGRSQRIASLIPSKQSRTYSIPANRYAIVLKKDEQGSIDAAGNRYEEFYFPAAAEVYEIHLFPPHQRNTTVTILSPDSTADNKELSLDPSFNVYFSDDMIQPIVEQNIELSDENKTPVPVDMQWRSKRHLVLKPRESLRPSSAYTVIVQLEARNVEAERLREMGEASFITGATAESVSPVDPASLRFDLSVPGMARLDWTLPPGANGSEMRIRDGETTDLQAKTNYTFLTEELESIEYKIVPYRLIGGGKAYNHAALEAPFKNIPRAALYGLTHEVLKNTPDSMEIRFTFSKPPPDGFEVLIKGGGKQLTAASKNGNTFTWKDSSPARIPDEKMLFSLTINGYEDDYLFAVQRPADAEFYAAFEQRVLASMNAIAEKFRAYQQKNPDAKTLDGLYREYTAYVYPAAHTIDEYKKRVKNNGVFAEIESLYTELSEQAAANTRRKAFLMGLGRRFLNFEIYGGTSFTTPWLIIGASDRIYLFTHTCLDIGSDFGFIPGKDYQGDVNYFSIYPYARFNTYFGPQVLKFYIGAGCGWMMSWYHDNDENNSFITPAFDAAGGMRLYFSDHSGIALSYSLRTPLESFFQTFNQKLTLGWLIRY